MSPNFKTSIAGWTLTCTDADECAERIRWVLSRPDEAAAIRAAGRARCLKDHPYQACWTKVFRMAGILEE